MRVVSLVPSWTETLIEAGIEVVGRTRFCIHPNDKVSAVPVVGGTKDWDFSKILELRPDLLILDREENPKFMAEQERIPYLDTHVTRIDDVAPELMKMAQKLGSKELQKLANRWVAISQKEPLTAWDGHADFPGLLSWGKRPERPIERLEYIIWKRPWMGVAKNTFIGSTLEKCGFGPYLASDHVAKYPVLNLESGANPRETTFLMFASEPYPFLTISKSLERLGYPYALVDGESFSWFGVRSLRFFEKAFRL